MTPSLGWFDPALSEKKHALFACLSSIGSLYLISSPSQTFMMSITARQASSWSPATMTPFPAASPLAFTTSAGKSALETPETMKLVTSFIKTQEGQRLHVHWTDVRM